MKSKVKGKVPEFILKGSKQTAVILDIDEYREMLEQLENIEGLKMLQEMR